MNILLAVVLGSIFGFALYKSGAADPKKILAMLRLEDMTLAKTILFGIGTASILMSLAYMIGILDINHLSIKTTHLGVITGGLIFGLGFGSVGACPGTCVAAAGGTGFRKALSVIIGGLTGAFTFSISYSWFKKLGLFDAMNLGKLTLFNISDKFPSLFNAGFIGLLAVGLLIATVAYMLPARLRTEKAVNKHSVYENK